MGEGAQARCRAHAAIRRRIAQARELSGRIGAALQISAAPCARGGYDLSGPCLSDLIVRFRGSERDGGWWTGSPLISPTKDSFCKKVILAIFT